VWGLGGMQLDECARPQLPLLESSGDWGYMAGMDVDLPWLGSLKLDQGTVSVRVRPSGVTA